MSRGESGEWVDCATCHGVGADHIGSCPACGGRGEVWVEYEPEEENKG
jgi:DnaJ-class molecular chaperone